MATTPNYDVNYDDKRFTEVEADKKAALNEVDVTYGSMIGQSDKYYQQQIDAAQQWADKQSQIQQEQTDFAIEKVNQQKDQAHKDYLKEQSGAYVDWQKQSNQYGANAEQMAAQGMAGSGYSESSQVSMYNTYQNRAATARESYNRAVLNYDNAIKDAQLQNNALLAEIAYKALQTQLELSLEGFQYKNSLIIEQSNKKLEVENTYYNRYQDVLDQINTENQLAENVRQFDEKIKFETTQAKLERDFKKAQADLDRQHDKDMLAAKTEAEKDMLEAKYQQDKKLLADKLENDKKLLEYQNSLKGGGGSISKASGGGSGGSSGSSSKSSGGSSGGISKTSYNPTKSPNREDKTKTSKLTVDQKSVLALGYGPISASELNRLVSQGLVQEYQDGNKLKYRHSAKYFKNKQMYNLIK